MTMLEKLQRYFDDKTYGQGELEALANVPRGRISKWKNGQGEPTVSAAMRIARVLRVPVEWLIDDTKGWPPPGHVVPERERQVAEIAERYGWDFVYWRLMDVISGKTPASVDPEAATAKPADRNPTPVKRKVDG